MNGKMTHAGLAGLAIMGTLALVLAGCDGGNGVAPVPGETGTIVGRVVLLEPDGGTTPLGEITVSAGGVTDRTGSDGRFRLRGVPAGDQVLNAQADPARGLQVWGTPADRTVRVRAGETTDVGDVIMIDPHDLPDPPSL